MAKRTYVPGDHLAACDVCGFTFYRSELRRRWDNMLVCDKDFERRHPQDFVRGTRDNQAVLDARPQQPDIFLAVNQVKPEDL